MREVLSTIRENKIFLITIGAFAGFIAAVVVGDFVQCRPISWFESQAFRDSELAQLKAVWKRASNSGTFLPMVVRGNRLDVVVRQYPLSLDDESRLYSLLIVWKQVYSRNHGANENLRCVSMRAFDTGGRLLESGVSEETPTGILTNGRFP